MGSNAIPPPLVRRKTAGLRAALAVAVLGAAAVLAAPPTAQAAEGTLGAAAAPTGRDIRLAHAPRPRGRPPPTPRPICAGRRCASRWGPRRPTTC
ncbi:hypothetical protein ACFVHW_06430 [Streptomyces sp. NPDC127110]|uniref:hypothetical protein n=1 Tax=Streptomyces sp. NPDC127110 TaxID=3345362 RepID=UPI00363426C9